ncbi:MAG: AEC family transporter [Clostridia bacterium]|nr:AEC family transporter [Clostridia bacterium]
MSFFDIFLFAFNAITPIVLLILTGFILKRIGFLNDNFLQTANKFVFNVSLPVLLFFNVYNIGNLGEIQWNTVIFALIIILLLFISGFVYSKLFIKDNRQKGVVWQSFYRSNFAIIGLPLSQALGGDEGIAIASILSAFSIPVFNALAVVSLSVYTSSDGKNKIRIKDILIKIAKNPLIIGVALGLVMLGIRQFIPTGTDGDYVFTIRNNLPFLYDAIGMMSKIASPLALVVLGGKFRFDAIKGLKKQIIAGSFARIIFAPALGIAAAMILSGISSFFSFNAAHYAAFIALFGSPVAVSSAIMASQMDNDDQLANQILVWTSIASVVTVFVTVVILKSVGMI